MGNILSEGGWIREAISAYDITLRLKPDYAEAYYNRGTTKTLIGEYETAITDFDEAIGLNPEFVEAHYNRGQTKVSLSEIEGARYDLEIALKLAEECDHIKSNIQRYLRNWLIWINSTAYHANARNSILLWVRSILFRRDGDVHG